MILVTGAAGFIGSAFVWKLNREGCGDILLADKLRSDDKWLNLRKRDYAGWIDKDRLFDWLEDTENAGSVEAVVHMGACSSTTERDADFLMENNSEYTKKLWIFATKARIPFLYASSAATYGAGESGYNDEGTAAELHKLMPMNKYGWSKKIFDDWALKQTETPPKWAGLKFFNVYGPQEYHKGRMASMVFHAFNQFRDSGNVRLFMSHKKEYADGGQLRDFVYVKDVVDILYWMLTSPFPSGIYNLGTGKARSFLDLALGAVRVAAGNPALSEKDVIRYIPMPDDLREKYQYFTEAKMEKLRKAGYSKDFTSLEEGVRDYVANYLATEDPYL
ncbi:MAG: ADP-glyceromanno-heptose 6-epimerase [Fusobacteriaceae bacterium]|jgi:ADP-L-glycero-D-manno-heptose 6-epimerase|nr:ADP-glyceromanno-heptose 6-epimerase [Fusobacteriaceae bacterium]